MADSLPTAAEDRRLAYRHRPGRGPTIIFLPGYRSDMEGDKATALDAWAAAEGRAMLRFDYAGCGVERRRFRDPDPERLARRRAGDDRRGGRRAGRPGRLVDGRLADAARRARPARAGRRPGRHRRGARFHQLGLHRGAEADASCAMDGWSSPTPMARRRRHHPHLLGERRGAAPDARADRRSIVRCGCSTARRTATCPGPGRSKSCGASVQPTCR